ncbi:MAG: efflux RND transporter permease subunit [Actinomycetota bacterium]|nr:efflux RND transporter permease subunit [Actinomycetota bacterium]
MMRWIIGSSLKFRFLVVFFAAGMIYFGVQQLRHMPVDVFPEFAPPRVEIQTISLGLTAAEVEALVSVPLEEALHGVPGLDVIRSKSVADLSSIELIFEPGTDLLNARQVVQERVATVTPTLPTWAAPPFMMQPLSATSRAMKIGLSSENLSVMQMSNIAYWKIKARLLQVPGVANVTIFGERLQQRHVQVDPRRLRREGVSLLQIMEVTSNALENGLLQFSEGVAFPKGGWIDTPNQRLGIRHVPSVTTPRDLARVVVARRNGKVLRIGDVARVLETHMPLWGDAVINDGAGLMLIVEKFPWANTLDVTHGVEEALDALRPALPGIEIDAEIFRPATFIEASIDNLTNALLIGCLLLILVLGAFLYEWRTALISVVAIPLSLIAAGLVLYQRGATINVMILAGFVIALGDVVDDAIIDVENIVRRLRQNRKEGGGKSTARIILDASLEVRSAIVYATLIEVVAIAPVFFLGGLSGSFFRPLAFSYALALGVSMVVALTVTPALSLILLRKAPLEGRESPLLPRLQRGYHAILSRIVYRPRRAFSGAGVVAVSGLVVLPFLGQSLLPSFKERDFLMHWLTPPGTSLPEEKRISIRGCRELMTIPGVRNCGSHIGQALLADEVVGVDFGENWISVDPTVDYDATLAKIHEVVDGYPGLYRDVLTYLKERIREVLTGSEEAIVVRIWGPDLEILRDKADEIFQILSGIDGVVEEHVDLETDIPQLDIEVDLAKAQRYGIKPGDVRRTVAALVASEEVGDIFVGGKAYDVHVWGTPEVRDDLTSIRQLLLDTPGGDQIPLTEVADVRMTPTPNAILREDLARRLDVGANVQGRDLGSVVRELDDRLEEIRFPLEYRAEILGEYAERQAAQGRMLIYAVAAAIGVFLLLQVSFGSWRLATLSFLTLPMALVGGVLAAYMADGIISLGSLVGFLTVLGVAARNGIMLISHYQHLERYEGETFGPSLVLRGARERLAPILMTALASAFALLPLVVAGEIPGHEIEHPMAVVIMGGLVTSTLLNLVVVPSLYLRFARPGGAVPQRS